MNSKTPIILIALLACASCSFSISVNSSAESSPIDSSDHVATSETSREALPSSEEEMPSTPELSSEAVITSESSSAERFDTTIDFYAINDFHGAVLPENGYPGIESVGAYLKQAKSNGAVLINSGDMYQGTIESDYNHGELLSKCMKNIGMDTFTIGNHEFDWGAEWVSKDAGFAEMNFLGANIYHYDINQKKVLEFASELCAKYTIVERAGWKIGVIGTIGYDQITSIASQFIDDYTFIDPIPVIKSLSDELRTEKGCDSVVLSHHGSQDELLADDLTSLSPVSNLRYIDAAFCAHTHQNERTVLNGVPFVQTEGYGKSIAYVSLNFTEEGVSLKEYSTSKKAGNLKDSELASLVNEFKAVSDVAGNEVLCRADSTYYDRYEASSNLIVKSIGEYEKSINVNIDFAISNYARTALRAPGYEITYKTLYATLPFDNLIVLAKVKGNELIRELGFDSIYAYRPNPIELSSTSYYTCAIVDFVALHRNTRRIYDYFPSIEVLDIQDITYRDISAKYLRALDTFRGSDHANTLECFNKNAF